MGEIKMDGIKIDDIKKPCGDIEFVHFDTNKDCDKFLHFASHMKISISHKCCDGTGCGIKNIQKEQLKIIMNEYLQLNSNNIEATQSSDIIIR